MVLPWDADPGQHHDRRPRHDRRRRVQTAARAEPFPDGSSGIQEVVVDVEPEPHSGSIRSVIHRTGPNPSLISSPTRKDHHHEAHHLCRSTGSRAAPRPLRHPRRLRRRRREPATADDTCAGPAEETRRDAAEETADAGAQTFGAGCAAVPTDGAGSFDGMATDPVATAASNNPLLKTLVTAVGADAGLVDTLNSAPRP